MAERTLAGSLELTGDWDLGQDGWKDGMDLNLLKLSVVGQGVADELVSATPGSPTEGDIVLFDDTHPTNPGDIAVYDEAAWVYIVPSTGWRMWDSASAFMREFNGATWVEVASGGGDVEEAPVDGKTYGRKDAAWAEIVAGGGGSSGGTAKGVQLSRVAAQAVATSTFVPIEWDTEVKNDDGMFVSGTSTTDIVMPEDGWYSVSATLTYGSTVTTGFCHIRIYVNGTDSGFSTFVEASNDTNDPPPVTGLLWLAENDVVTIVTRQTSGGSVNMESAIVGVAKFSSGSGPSATVTVADQDSNLAAVNVGQYLRFTYAGAKTLTVQADATEALPADGEWHIRNAGTDALTLVADTGVTINAPSGGTLVLDPGMTVTLKRVAEDEFDLLGQTVAA